MPEAFPPDAIAIIGMAGRFPGAGGLDAFWDSIRSGVEVLDTFTAADLDAAGVSAAERADPLFVQRGTALDGALLFDAAFFGFTPREAEILDPQHRIFLECAWEAMEHSGYGPGTPAGVVGVYAGASMNTYLPNQILRNGEAARSAGGFALMIGNDKDFLCSRVSYKLDLRGPSMTIQTACSSSLVAVEAACRALQRGACDLALAGGVSVGFPQRSGYHYEPGMILSPDGRCRPFDAAAAGTRIGAGVGIVVLKRLAAALADHDTIHAVIRGIAVNNDGAAKIGYTAPGPDGQVEVIATAQTLAGVTPDSISYAETHGTATPLGDAVEIAALKRAFGETTQAPGFCRLGAVKANIGHLDVAAGVAGLIKTVLALKHREIPPLVNFRAANPALELDGSPFSASAHATPWVSDGPRRACVSSFGIGGTNAHAVLEEAPLDPLDPRAAGNGERSELLVVSAKTAAGLSAACERLAQHLAACPEQDLADIAWTLRAGRQAFAHRRAVVASRRDEAIAALREPARVPVMSGVHEGGVRPVAFLFSGQGSQHAGMGAALYASEPVYRDAIDRCAELLLPELGLDIRTVMFGADDAALGVTALTQPALFCTHYALAALWRNQGVVPSAMLGHSVGEYAACVLAGVMSLADALRVVAARGRLMATMPEGRMAAVSATLPAISPHLPTQVEFAAFNGPGLCTIAGPSAALAESLERLAKSGIEATLLRTSHAFHTAMMSDALAPFMALLSDVRLSPPAIPYISNVSGTWITDEQATSPSYYADHLRSAVRFADGMRTLAADPSLFFLEVGPGRSLAALARANLPPAQAARVTASLPHPGAGGDDVRAMLEAGGRLWLAGSAAASALSIGDAAAGPRRRVPLPAYPFQRREFRVAPVASPVDARPADTGQVRCYAPVWVRDEVPSPASLYGTWLVVGGHGPLRQAVSSRLDQAGAHAVLARASAVTAGPLAERAPDGVVLLTGLDPARAAESGRALYHELLALVGALEALPEKRRLQLIVATTGARGVLDEPVTDPESVLAFGPVLALPAESEWLTIRLVDVPATTPEGQASLLVREARATAPAADVAWRGGRRWLRQFTPIEPEAGELPLRQGGVYLITGGLGGIGLALAAWLARSSPSARLLLTGRKALPRNVDPDDPACEPWAREAARAIREIEGVGGDVLTVAGDVADAAAMRAAIALATARWGPLNGVIHAAGNPGSGKLTLLQDDADVAATLSPKVAGLAVLTELLRGAELDFVALMSSINAVLPAPGVGAYAAANVALDSFAESGPHPKGWRRVVAIDWSAWAQVGMAANLIVPGARRASHDALLRTAIPTDVGVDLFGRILASGRNRVVVTSFDLQAALDAGAKSRPEADHVAPAGDAVRPELSSRQDLSSRYDPPRGTAELAVAEIWTELIGIPDIGAHDDFFELGGHSLLATRVLSRISQIRGVQLTLREFFDAPTIRGLSEKIEAASNHAKPLVTAGPHADAEEREEFLL